MQEIAPNIYVETGFQGCNPGFISSAEGVIMVDTPFRPTDINRWKEEIDKKGEVRYLINTEHHGDHIMGNGLFPGVVISHHGSRDKFQMAWEQIQQMRELMFPLEELPLLNQLKPKIPDITFTERLGLYLGDHYLELIHMPGHTSNEIGIYIPKEKVLFAGDNVFNNTWPFMHEAIPLEWLKTLDKIMEMEIEIIVPGHGEVCNKAALVDLSDYLKEVVEEIQKAIQKGLSKEDTSEYIMSLDWFHRLPDQPELKDLAPEFKRLSLANVYDQLKGGISRRKN